MNTKSLPPRPSLEQFKKQAKDLLKEVHAGRSETFQKILECLVKDHPRSGSLGDMERGFANIQLADVQLLMARDYGFESWPKFAKHIADLTAANSDVSTFESAVDAVVSGDVDTLKHMVHKNPRLVQDCSARLHHATLLHYVGANGVENYRQKTPKNAVEIATVLLRAGADINAVASIYGGSTTLGLVATSIFPVRCGVQIALIDLLIDHGADFGGQGLVNACLANGRGQAAEHLAKRGAPLNLEGAAGVGRLDLVRTFFNFDGTLQKDATQKQLECGFMWACEFGRIDVVDFLLQRGFNVDAMPRGETGLHWAAFGGHPDVVGRLLGERAPLDVVDKRFHATPLGWALHGFGDPPPEADRSRYYEVIRLLTAAGARVDSECREKFHDDSRMIAALNGDGSTGNTLTDY